MLVSVHGVDSDPVPVISGVPQGSVLGPLLFLVYVNDLCFSNFSSNSFLVLYADDTTLYKPLSHSSDLADFQADINTIHSWFVSNHLSANASKTKAMVISTKKNPYPDMQLYLDNQVIERVSSSQQNFLGFWSLTASPCLFTSTIYVKKLVALLVLSIGPSPVLPFAPVASFILPFSAQSWNMGVSHGIP